jgi:hypothetical protein
LIASPKEIMSFMLRLSLATNSSVEYYMKMSIGDAVEIAEEIQEIRKSYGKKKQ